VLKKKLSTKTIFMCKMCVRKFSSYECSWSFYYVWRFYWLFENIRPLIVVKFFNWNLIIFNNYWNRYCCLPTKPIDPNWYVHWKNDLIQDYVWGEFFWIHTKNEGSYDGIDQNFVDQLRKNELHEISWFWNGGRDT